MPGPYVLNDPQGNNYVDSINRKVDEKDCVYYELRGRNALNAQRVLRVYETSLKPFFVENDKDKEASNLGVVHNQMTAQINDIKKHFKIEFNFTKPFTLMDDYGNNFVDFIDRKIDENGVVYYEATGRNNDGRVRIVHFYDKKQEYYEVENGDKKRLLSPRLVHTQIIKKQPDLLKHFGLNKLDFTNPSGVNPDLDKLPSREFFILAAKRALDHANIDIIEQSTKSPNRMVLNEKLNFYETKGNRLDLFRNLILGTTDGYYPFAATTAYGLSLLTYIAINYDTIEKTHLERLYDIYKYLAGDIPKIEAKVNSDEFRLALASGLKAEVNELANYLEILYQGEFINDSLIEYGRDLVFGNSEGRVVIDKQTDNVPTDDTKYLLKRSIPSFFPIPPSSGETDQIVIPAGGGKDHAAIVCIWKQGVDKDGIPVEVGDDRVIDRYRVYRTICNAGLGATSFVHKYLYHPLTVQSHDGKVYSVCTQELKLPEGESYSDESMRHEILKLVNAEHSLLLFHNIPEQGDNQKKEDLLEWKRINRSFNLGPVETNNSVLSSIQTTGNCTIRSIKEYLRWELIRAGTSILDAEKILDEHWRFASENSSENIESDLSKLMPSTGAIYSDQDLLNVMDVTLKEVSESDCQLLRRYMNEYKHADTNEKALNAIRNFVFAIPDIKNGHSNSFFGKQLKSPLESFFEKLQTDKLKLLVIDSTKIKFSSGTYPTFREFENAVIQIKKDKFDASTKYN